MPAMGSSRPPEQAAGMLHTLVLLQRYTLELTQVFGAALDDGPSSNIDGRILLALESGGVTTPSGLVKSLGVSRSTVARSLSRLRRAGLVQSTPSVEDRRRAVLEGTAKGRRGVARLEHALADFFDDGSAVVKEVMLLHGRETDPASDHEGTGPALDVVGRLLAVGTSFVEDATGSVERFGISDAVDRFALVYLAQGESRPSQLAEYLHLTPAGATGLVERLEGLGLVERQAGGLASDRRVALVWLTRRGRQATEAMLEAFGRHEDAILDILASTLGPVSAPTP